MAEEKAKRLRIWNGRGVIRDTHLYVCAHSKKDACKILAECFSRGENTTGARTKLEIGRWYRELSVYWSPDCWGNSMEGITPERGIWESKGLDKPLRIWPKGE